RIQPPDRPTDQGQPASRQFGVDKQILQACRGPKQPRRAIWCAAEQFRAEIDFRRDSRRTCRPEHSAWMRVGVIRDLVAVTKDFGNEVRIFFGVFSDDEEGRAGFEALEESE